MGRLFGAAYSSEYNDLIFPHVASSVFTEPHWQEAVGLTTANAPAASTVELLQSVPAESMLNRPWLRLFTARTLFVGGHWDQGTHIHPDERFLTMVLDALKLPKNLGEFFDSTKSPMSPYNKNYGFFVYGTLPIFIVRVVAEGSCCSKWN